MPMAQDHDISQQLADTVKTAAQKRAPLAIAGGGSKRFYTGEIAGEKLDVTGHRGIVFYEPTELVVTARAGTPFRRTVQPGWKPEPPMRCVVPPDRTA